MQFDLSKISNHIAYNLINGLVAPRPIALVTSLSPEGVLNAAPFSSYNYLCLDPPILGFGVAALPNGGKGLKDTARNIEFGREYVVNVVTEDIGSQMNICGVDFPPEVDKLEKAGFTPEPSLVVKTPRIKEAHAALECRLYEILKPGPGEARIILGKVAAIFVEDRFVDPKGPYILAKELHAIGRMNGLNNYVRTRDAFIEIQRLNYAQWEKGERG
jgi:flavin reductase (DIM6/NTAB) family NADH-FMN oxidoreductase RutF